MSPSSVQVAFITDANALHPTMLAMWSALKGASEPLRVIFVGVDLSDDEWAWVHQIAAAFPASGINAIRFDKGLLQGVESPSGYISSATYARLFLHRFTSGRVLYLDGDILVTGDVARIGRVNLQDRLAAAVCDYVVQKWSSRAMGKDWRRAGTRLERVTPITDPFPPQTYVNAGVMLLDMDRIRSEPDIVRQLEDVQSAGRFPLADQDHLNHVLAGRLVHLGPEWNCSWRRLGRQRRFQKATGIVTDAATAADKAVIIHYHGKNKPWQPVPIKHTLRLAPPAWEYRRARKQFERDFPSIPGQRSPK